MPNVDMWEGGWEGGGGGVRRAGMVYSKVAMQVIRAVHGGGLHTQANKACSVEGL